MRIKRDTQPLLPYVSRGKDIEKVLESFNMNDVANSLSIPLQPYVNLSKKRNAKRGCDNKFNQGCPISFGLWFFDVWNDCYKTRHCTSSGSLLAGSWLILSRHIGKSSSQLWDIWEGQKVTVSVMERFLWNYMDSMTDMVTGDMDTHKSTSKYVFTLSGFPDCRWLLHYLWASINIFHRPRFPKKPYGWHVSVMTLDIDAWCHFIKETLGWNHLIA